MFQHPACTHHSICVVGLVYDAISIMNEIKMKAFCFSELADHLVSGENGGDIIDLV